MGLDTTHHDGYGGKHTPLNDITVGGNKGNSSPYYYGSWNDLDTHPHHNESYYRLQTGFNAMMEYMNEQNQAEAHRRPASDNTAATKQPYRIKIDPNTIGHNYFGSNYIGPKNPRDIYGNWSYDPSPTSLLDAFAKEHDIAYDKNSSSGITGVLFNPANIKADYTLVGDAFWDATSLWSGASISERLEGFAVSAAIGIGALPKTILYYAAKGASMIQP